MVKKKFCLLCLDFEIRVQISGKKKEAATKTATVQSKIQSKAVRLYDHTN